MLGSLRQDWDWFQASGFHVCFLGFALVRQLPGIWTSWCTLLSRKCRSTKPKSNMFQATTWVWSSNFHWPTQFLSSPQEDRSVDLWRWERIVLWCPRVRESLNTTFESGSALEFFAIWKLFWGANSAYPLSSCLTPIHQIIVLTWSSMHNVSFNIEI